MALDETSGPWAHAAERTILTLDRRFLPELLIGDRDWLGAQLEDSEVIVVREAFCPERPLLTFAERLEAILHGVRDPKQNPAPEDCLIVGAPEVSPLAEYARNGNVWENDYVLGRASGSISIMAFPGTGRIAKPTSFACTAAAWDDLTPTEQGALAPLRSLHGLWQDRLYHEREPRHEALMQWMARESTELPLVQRMPSGRHGLLVDDTAIQITGMEFSRSETFLADLRDWVTQPAFVYRHSWEPGDLVIWNSVSVLYRELPRPLNPMWKMTQVWR